jgi:hypothetical protein
MAEKVLNQIFADLREVIGTRYPSRGKLTRVRLLRHIPKKDYVAYDLRVDFKDGTERLVAKMYRSGRCGGSARTTAEIETANLQYVHRTMMNTKLSGVPCLVGNFSDKCVVVTDKIYGPPLQSLIMKVALLPQSADGGSLALAASRTGKWLRGFHRATADLPEPFDADALVASLAALCENCRARGLDPITFKILLESAHDVLSHCDRVLPSSAVLSNFTPLSAIVTEDGVGFSDFSKMKCRGNSLEDVAMFVASVEALGKYPFCAGGMVSQIQESFSLAYGLTASETGTVHVLKMKILLEMFVQGRTGSNGFQNGMWSNVMRRAMRHSVPRPLARIVA